MILNGLAFFVLFAPFVPVKANSPLVSSVEVNTAFHERIALLFVEVIAVSKEIAVTAVIPCDRLASLPVMSYIEVISDVE